MKNFIAPSLHKFSSRRGQTSKPKRSIDKSAVKTDAWVCLNKVSIKHDWVKMQQNVNVMTKTITLIATATAVHAIHIQVCGSTFFKAFLLLSSPLVILFEKKVGRSGSSLFVLLLCVFFSWVRSKPNRRSFSNGAYLFQWDTSHHCSQHRGNNVMSWHKTQAFWRGLNWYSQGPKYNNTELVTRRPIFGVVCWKSLCCTDVWKLKLVATAPVAYLGFPAPGDEVSLGAPTSTFVAA